MDAEKHLHEMKCQYAEMQKEAIDFAYLLNADPASIKRSRCITLCYVEGKTRAVAAGEVGYSNAEPKRPTDAMQPPNVPALRFP